MAKASPKYPFIQNPSTRIYWDDLHAEPGLKIVSLSARGLWTYHMLAIMAASGGYLAVEGNALDVAALAAYIGKSFDEVAAAYEELRKWRVFSVDRFGTPYNRRMVEQKGANDASRSNGKKGGRPRKPVDNSNLGFDLGLNQVIGKPLNAKGKSGSKTYMEPRRNLDHNLERGPRARGSQDSLSNPMHSKSLRGEKNPASNGAKNGHGVIGPDKVLARIIRTAERQDTEEARGWAMHVLMMLDVPEAAELSEFATPVARVAALIEKANISIDLDKKAKAEKRSKQTAN